MIAHGIHGYLPSQCVLYLMQMHIKERTIWLTRHGESEYNLESRLGGDPPLTPSGKAYSQSLLKFLQTRYPPEKQIVQKSDPHDDSQVNLSILTSTLHRTIETVEGFDATLYEIQHIRYFLY